MTVAVKSFSLGVKESSDALVDNSLTIALGSAVGAGVGFLIGGTPTAWLAAKISSLVLGMIYGMDRPVCVVQPNLLCGQNCRTIGNVVTSLGTPPLLIHVVHILVG